MVRQKGDTYPLEIAAAQKAAGDDVKVLLMQDAVLSCSGDKSSFCCKEDAEARGVGCGNQVDYSGIVKMVFEADIVNNW
jgi:hypothetical protein